MPRVFVQTVMIMLCVFAGPVLNRVDDAYAAGGSPVERSAVVFVAHDHGFSGPDRIPAGVTTVQVVNRGQDVHHIQILQLMEGKTAEEFRATLATTGRFPGWVRFVGGPNAVLPGDESLATMNLPEGDYLLVCIIPNKAGVPHMALGMQKPLSVKPMKPTLVT